MHNTRYGDSGAAKSLFAIVNEQENAKTVNRKVSAFLSDYSYTATQLEGIADPHAAIRLQKMWMHSTDALATETFGANVLSTHLRNVIKIRFRAFEHRARARIKAVKLQEQQKE